MLERMHGGKQTHAAGGSMQGWGHTYDLLTGLLFGGSERRVRAETISRAHIRPGDRVLEVGCGTGTLTLAAKQASGPAGEVFGTDVAEDMLAAARKKAARAGVMITFQQARIESLPFPPASFDVVLSSLMLHHVHGEQAKRQGLAEVYRVLKPGGVLLVAEFQPPKAGPLKWLVRLGLGARMADSARPPLEQMLQEAGFTLESVPPGFPVLMYLRAVRQM